MPLVAVPVAPVRLSFVAEAGLRRLPPFFTSKKSQKTWVPVEKKQKGAKEMRKKETVWHMVAVHVRVLGRPARVDAEIKKKEPPEGLTALAAVSYTQRFTDIRWCRATGGHGCARP